MHKKKIKIIKKEKITHIYTTFSPISPHLLGKKIKLNHRELYWLAEYRDLCSFSASNNWIKKTLRFGVFDVVHMEKLFQESRTQQMAMITQIPLLIIHGE